MQKYGFQHVLSLSFLHFATGSLLLEFITRLHLFGSSVKYMPLRDNLLTASAGVGSIVFMNASLKTNSVGFYQISKLCVIPVVLLSEYFGQQKLPSNKILFSLAILLTGVGISTITDVEFSYKGCAYACVAVGCTAQFQIWQGSKQREHGLGAIQVAHSISAPMSFLALLGAATFEREVLWYRFSADHVDVILLVLSCLIALMMNVTSYSLLGKTSVVTFQVVGHAKTCLILVIGFLFFTKTINVQVVKNMFGLAIALTGMLLYGHLKSIESVKSTGEEAEDCVDSVWQLIVPQPSDHIQATTSTLDLSDEPTETK
eukprot:CAMPEP_0184288760 /NCGR_PEP_ID=MMETSP1049-20130417/1231_1 /TAXON_ID=77928 /ORGANISM="Proteomonas sulcata, Strain CCMP704" /LENGTH=315 /DNA_ID=CAMNT_0026595283 /DNA_START=216 /DNA_END=1163 /DNA_ORIENTATION=+